MLTIRIATASLTLIERSEHHDEASDYIDGRDSLYCLLSTRSFELYGDSEAQLRKSNPTTDIAISTVPLRFYLQVVTQLHTRYTYFAGKSKRIFLLLDVETRHHRR